MNFAAIFLLLAGWAIVLASLPLLHSPAMRTCFLAAGLAVEALGLALLFRTHIAGERG